MKPASTADIADIADEEQTVQPATISQCGLVIAFTIGALVLVWHPLILIHEEPTPAKAFSGSNMHAAHPSDALEVSETIDSLR